ncbi:MAG: hypothetical protein H6702_22245 [Myxococcales bacterium]|nr:hypothetical protein [Myxococcales bacterium]
MRLPICLCVCLASPLLATAANARCDAIPAYMTFRQTRDHQAEGEAQLDRHRRIREHLDLMHATHGRVPPFHISFDTDTSLRSVAGFQICTPDGVTRTASITQYNIGLSVGAEVPRYDLELRGLYQLKQTDLSYTFPTVASDSGEAPADRTLTGNSREVAGLVLRATRWFEVGALWVGPAGAGLWDRGFDTPAPVPMVVTRTDAAFWALSLGVPALSLQGDLLLNPDSGDVVDARLRVREVDLQVAALSGGVRWDDVDETLRVGARARRVLGLLQAGVEFQTGDVGVRSARAGLDLTWRGGLSDHDLFPELETPPTLLAYGFAGLELVGTTYDSVGTRAATGRDARLHGAELAFEVGGGVPNIALLGPTFVITGKLAYNRPDLLDAMPSMANRFEATIGVATRNGF